MIILDKEAINKISNNNEIDLEYVYLGMLNDENMIGVHPLYDSNLDVKGNLLVTITKLLLQFNIL